MENIKNKMKLSDGEPNYQLQQYIAYGMSLIEKLKSLCNIEGVLKLEKKIRQEIKYLRKLCQKDIVKLEQLSCTNLRHLGALVDCAMEFGTLAVCQSFHLNKENKLTVDIVSEKGTIWRKVIARNPKSLSALSHGEASYGARSILDQAEDYMHCATLYPCMYKPPKVIFEFTSGIEEALANKLQNLGVIVKGDILPNFENKYDVDDYCSSETDESEGDGDGEINHKDDFKDTNYRDYSEGLEPDTLNLDVTAMMAYVSNMTNGYCNYKFKQPVLTQQAEWETKRPVKPVLEKIFQGKKLVCCQTAWDDFEKIMETLGGSMEKERKDELKTRLQILPDDAEGEDDPLRSNLKVRGHVRLRSKMVFNFGQRIKALTVSANEGFVRAAQQQGITYAAFIHESRALTEGKEPTATKIIIS